MNVLIFEGPQLDNYEEDGFVVHEVDDEPSNPDDAEKSEEKRKKKKSRVQEDLDEEDLEIIEEASGVTLTRKNEERTFSRLKKANQPQQRESLFGSDDGILLFILI